MSPEDFSVYQPQTEENIDAYEDESKLRRWCKELNLDPTDPDTHESYLEQREETEVDKFFTGLDPDERAGWQDNMNKA